MATREPIDQVKEFANAALASMGRLSIAPTPNNYLIWYSHCSGCYPDLSRALSALEQSGEPFSEERLGELHERFFGSGRQAQMIDETCQRVEASIGDLLHKVGELSGDAGSYGAKLEVWSGELTPARPVVEIEETVRQILEETRGMQARAERIEAELGESSEQITGLRGELANAQREANTDGLTGIANRKCFDHRLQAVAEEARQSGQPLSLLLADIDYFKLFNDTYGHPVGDEVLKLVAQVFTSSVKGRDLPARYGGEEFAVILPQTDLEGAHTLAEQICTTLAGKWLRLKASGRSLGRVTVSIGCSQFRSGESPADLLERTDQALYEAKRQGRNRVVAKADAAAGRVA
ncbi:MAG: GGDEF domain-containing protein [Geminicoccaceae bacterium]